MAGRRWSRPPGRSPRAGAGPAPVGSRRSRARAWSPTSTSPNSGAARGTSETSARGRLSPDPGCGRGRTGRYTHCRLRRGTRAWVPQGQPRKPPGLIRLGGSMQQSNYSACPPRRMSCSHGTSVATPDRSGSVLLVVAGGCDIGRDGLLERDTQRRKVQEPVDAAELLAASISRVGFRSVLLVGSAGERLPVALWHWADGQAIRPSPDTHGPITGHDRDLPSRCLLEETAVGEDLAVLIPVRRPLPTQEIREFWQDLQRDAWTHLDRSGGRLIQELVEGAQDALGAAAEVVAAGVLLRVQLLKHLHWDNQPPTIHLGLRREDRSPVDLIEPLVVQQDIGIGHRDCAGPIGQRHEAVELPDQPPKPRLLRVDLGADQRGRT